MPLSPCLNCGQPVGEDERNCAACGHPRGAPAPATVAPDAAAVSPRRSRSLVGAGAALALILVSLAFIAVRRRAGSGAASAGASAAVSGSSPGAGVIAPLAVPIPAPTAAAPSAAAVVSAPSVDMQAALPENQEAELPPFPGPGSSMIPRVYGVVYDLATKRPVKGAKILFGGLGLVITDNHGWYRMDMPRNKAADGFDVRVDTTGYEPWPLQEQDPALASLSDAQRRGIAEEEDAPFIPLTVSVPDEVLAAELDLALIPRVWPAGMPPAVPVKDVSAPTMPEEPNDSTCRFYGVVYDLGTRKPLRRLELKLAGRSMTATVTTDGKGRYVLNYSVLELESAPPTLTAAAPGYRPGLMIERDPPMLRMGLKERRDIANTVDLAFDPVDIPGDCDDGLVRLDWAAVPLKMP